MKRYLHFIIRVYTSRLGKDLSQPYIQIFMQLLGSICFFYFHIFSFNFIIQHFSFPSWSSTQLYILFFTFEIYTYLAFFVFWKGLMQTVNFIHSGQFDLVLSKPASSWILSMFQGGGLHNLLAAVLGSIYLVLYLIKFNIPVSFISISLYLIFLSLSLFFLLCFSSIFITLNFYFGKLNTFGLGIAFQELFKYPAQVYPLHNLLFIIFIIPFSLLVTVPASLLINKPLPLNLLFTYLIAMAFVIFTSQLLWRRALRHYSSAA